MDETIDMLWCEAIGFLMRSNIPHSSLNSLRTFVFSARLGSFSAAGQVLSVTQGAVSQQVNRLEEYLGVKLFDRQPSGISLTSQGQRLFFAIERNIDQIDAAVTGMRGHAQLKTLVITTLNSFAVQWLIPRIGRFEAMHPDIRIQLETSVAPVNLASGNFDAAIRCGPGSWPDTFSELLFHDVVFPVTTPAYAAGLQRLEHPQQIVELPLLFDLDIQGEWLDWFKTAGVSAAPNLFYGYSDALVMLSALKHGKQGIALTQSILVESELQQGELVRLFEHSVPSRNSYYFLTANAVDAGSAIGVFQGWLMDEVSQQGRRT